MKRLLTLLAAVLLGALWLAAPAAAQSCEDAPSDGMREGCEQLFGGDEEGDDDGAEDEGTEDEGDEGGGLPAPGGDEPEEGDDTGEAGEADDGSTEGGESDDTGGAGGFESDGTAGGSTTGAAAQATLPATGGPALGALALLLGVAGAGLAALRRRLG